MGVGVGKEEAVGTAVGDGITRGLPIGATELVAASDGDAVDTGAQPDSTKHRPIAKAESLLHAFPPLVRQPPWGLDLAVLSD